MANPHAIIKALQAAAYALREENRNNVVVGITLIVVLLLLIISVGALLPMSSLYKGDANEISDLVKSYDDAASLIGADYVHLLAYDMVQTDNDLANCDPFKTAVLFLDIVVDEYRYEYHTYYVEGSPVTVQVKVFYRTVYIAGWQAASYIESNTRTNVNDIRDAINGLNNLNSKDLFVVKEINARHIDDVSYIFSAEKLEYLETILESNLIPMFYASSEVPNLDLSGIPLGYFQSPNPSLNTITSRYGYRIHPIKYTRLFHSGVDLVSTYGCNGMPIQPVTSGYVTRIQNLTSGYGKNITIRHTDSMGNEWISFYAHLSKINVKVGDYVSTDTIIGNVGSTGLSTGPHLHLEIKYKGCTIDPTLVIPLPH